MGNMSLTKCCSKTPEFFSSSPIPTLHYSRRATSRTTSPSRCCSASWRCSPAMPVCWCASRRSPHWVSCLSGVCNRWNVSTRNNGGGKHKSSSEVLTEWGCVTFINLSPASVTVRHWKNSNRRVCRSAFHAHCPCDLTTLNTKERRKKDGYPIALGHTFLLDSCHLLLVKIRSDTQRTVSRANNAPWLTGLSKVRY